jgi:hypothetical protein
VIIDCSPGSFRSGSGAPCIPCQSCALNAFPLVQCVTDATNPTQCQTQELVESTETNTNATGTTTPSTNATSGSGTGTTSGTGTGGSNIIKINYGPIDGSYAPCPVGEFRSSPDPNAPCVKCLSCSWNAKPLVECVIRRADNAQCQCNEGYFSNNRGGCLPNIPGSVAPPPVPVVTAPAPLPVMTAPAPMPVMTVPAPMPVITAPMMPVPVIMPAGTAPMPVPVMMPVGTAPVPVLGGGIGGGSVDNTNTGGGGGFTIGGALPSCPAGTFRRGVDAPCVSCLTCAYNAYRITECVTNGADPSQCQCNPGLLPNGRGGCLPPNVGGGTLDNNNAGGGTLDNNNPVMNPRPCTGCGFNAAPVPGVTCVTNAADPSQCQCNAGYMNNGRGGCVDSSITAMESIDSASADIHHHVAVTAVLVVASVVLAVMQL